MKGLFNSVCKRLVAGVVSLCLVASSTLQAANAVRAIWTVTFPVAAFLADATVSKAYAQLTFEQAASQGNVLGRSEVANTRQPSSDPANQSLTLNSSNPAVNGTTLNLNQLFQSGSPANSSALSSGAATYGSTANMMSESTTQQGNLLDPANTSPWSNAYKTVRGSALSRSHPDMTGDPIATGATSVVMGTDVNGFINTMQSACTTITTPVGSTSATHVPEMHSCVKYQAFSSCRVTRDLTTQNRTKPVFHFDGNVDHELTIQVRMREPSAIDVSASGNNPALQAAVAAAGGYYAEVRETLHGDLPANIRVEPFTAAEWPDPAPNQIVKYNQIEAHTGSVPTITYDAPTAANGYILTITMFTPAPGEQWVSMDVTATVTIITQQAVIDEPPGCSAPAAICGPASVPWTSTGSVEDEASTDKWQCLNADMSRFFGVAELSPADWGVVTPLYPGEPTTASSPICYVAEARSFSCPWTGSGSPPADTCSQYETDPACHFQNSSCLPENVDPVSGRCLFLEEEFDCGRDVITGSMQTQTTTSCAGPIRCMGNECVDPLPQETNPDFNNAAMQLQTAQWAQMDKVCDASGCEIFRGEGYSCKVAFFGVQDCCDTPVGISFADYIKLAYYTWKVADRKAIAQWMTDNGMETLSSAWEGLSNPIAETITDITQPVVDAWNSLASRFTGSLSSGAAATTPAIADAAEVAVDQFGAEVGGEAIAEAATAAGASSGALGDLMNSPLMTDFINPLMTVMMYYAIAVLLIQIIWSCDDKEFELNVKKEMKLCHDLGKFCAQTALGVCIVKKSAFCCYKSPLSRIIHEQLASRFGITWPAPSETPACPGFTPTQLASVDWSQVDLSEWIADLKLAGMMPTDATQANSYYGEARITALPIGNGTIGATGRQNAIDGLSETNVPTPRPSAAAENARAQVWGTLP